MKLLTKEILKKLTDRNALIAQRNRSYDYEYAADDKVIVKYFNPYGTGTWWIMSGEKLENGDWELFGLCELQYREWGTVLLSELESVRVYGQFKLERDRHFDGTYADLQELWGEGRWA
jgi:hypothetical protein